MGIEYTNPQITTYRILDATIGNADVAADAVVDFSKLAALASARLLVGSAGNVPTAVDVTGDVTISNAGATAIGAAKVTPPKMKTKAVVALADADAVLTAAQMINSGIFTINPGQARALTTDSAANIIAAMTGYQVGTWFDITIVCLAAFAVTLTSPGAGVTIVGSAIVNNNAGSWRVRIDAADAVTIYRM